MTTLDHRDLVAALRLVPGVLDAAVEPDALGGLGVLKLGLEPDVDEAAIAARVGRLLRERFGLAVDTSRAQVVPEAVLMEVAAGVPSDYLESPRLQATSDAQPASRAEPQRQPGRPASTGTQSQSQAQSQTQTQVRLPTHRRTAAVPAQRATLRPAITQLHLVSSGLEVTASVTLSSGEQLATGEVAGSASLVGVHRAVADATLRAVEQLVEVPVRFDVEHLEITPMGTERTVVVALSMLSAQGTERLTGAAAVREDVRQAVVRATLDALNRRLEMLLTDV